MGLLDFAVIGIFIWLGLGEVLVFIGNFIDKIKKRVKEGNDKREKAIMQAQKIIDQAKEQKMAEEMSEKVQEEPDNIQPITIEEHKDVDDDNDDLDYEYDDLDFDDEDLQFDYDEEGNIIIPDDDDEDEE